VSVAQEITNFDSQRQSFNVQIATHRALAWVNVLNLFSFCVRIGQGGEFFGSHFPAEGAVKKCVGN